MIQIMDSQQVLKIQLLRLEKEMTTLRSKLPDSVPHSGALTGLELGELQRQSQHFNQPAVDTSNINLGSGNDVLKLQGNFTESLFDGGQGDDLLTISGKNSTGFTWEQQENGDYQLTDGQNNATVRGFEKIQFDDRLISFNSNPELLGTASVLEAVRGHLLHNQGNKIIRRLGDKDGDSLGIKDKGICRKTHQLVRWCLGTSYT